MAHVVGHLTSKSEALSSNSITIYLSIYIYKGNDIFFIDLEDICKCPIIINKIKFAQLFLSY
jgi:hypothetical protein